MSHLEDFIAPGLYLPLPIVLDVDFLVGFKGMMVWYGTVTSVLLGFPLLILCGASFLCLFLQHSVPVQVCSGSTGSTRRHPLGIHPSMEMQCFEAGVERGESHWKPKRDLFRFTLLFISSSPFSLQPSPRLAAAALCNFLKAGFE